MRVNVFQPTARISAVLPTLLQVSHEERRTFFQEPEAVSFLSLLAEILACRNAAGLHPCTHHHVRALAQILQTETF